MTVTTTRLGQAAGIATAVGGAIFIAVQQTPGANPLDVARRVRDLLPKLRAEFPQGLDIFVPYDASEFIEASIREVFKTLAEAVLAEAGQPLQAQVWGDTYGDVKDRFGIEWLFNISAA